MTVSQIIAARNPDVVIDARVDNLIILADAQTGTIYDTQRNDAIALLVLHWLALENRGAAAAAGSIKSEKEGDLARSYGTTSSKTSHYLDQTTWGLQLKALRDGLIMSARNRTI